ncbi:hypothetical protein [Neotabrizicola sp. VNH66]|uniref:hypothetical protein n=1 Tax=Neotabrizicola sp. VNH66 TaxID=3400918 RepID=UPI003C2B70BA
MTRRPSPGEIVILAEREIKPIGDELARRRRDHERQEEERAQAAFCRVTPEAAAEICARAGFTPQRIEAMRQAPMAGSFAEAEQRQTETDFRHWTETADPDGPEWQALRASRASNPLVQAALAAKPKAAKGAA